MSTLTIREVAQYYGCKCKYERLPRYKYTAAAEWQPGTGTVNPSLLRDIERGHIRNIRPILKPLDAMTEEDAVEVLKRMNYSVPSVIAMKAHGRSALNTLFGADYCIEYYCTSADLASEGWEYRRVFMDLGYDCDNLIARGLAIDATKEGGV